MVLYRDASPTFKKEQKALEDKARKEIATTGEKSMATMIAQGRLHAEQGPRMVFTIADLYRGAALALEANLAKVSHLASTPEDLKKQDDKIALLAKRARIDMRHPRDSSIFTGPDYISALLKMIEAGKIPKRLQPVLRELRRNPVTICATTRYRVHGFDHKVMESDTAVRAYLEVELESTSGDMQVTARHARRNRRRVELEDERKSLEASIQYFVKDLAKIGVNLVCYSGGKVYGNQHLKKPNIAHRT